MQNINFPFRRHKLPFCDNIGGLDTKRMRDLIGRTLGHYRIVEKIGAGGMGEVYRATDERLDRDAAIKVLPDEMAGDEERLARFEREAKLLASLSHQNIATLYGLEEHDGERFLAMEVAEGETLAGRIERVPIPVDDALISARSNLSDFVV